MILNTVGSGHTTVHYSEVTVLKRESCQTVDIRTRRCTEFNDRRAWAT